MSNWPGNLIRKTPVTPSGGSASGVWSLAEAAYWKKQGLWPTLPGAPTIGTATAGGSSASVTFTAPTNTGTPSTITQYRVTSSPGAITATGASSPITVTGLTNGTSYTFTVAATNAAGTGPESASSNAVTPIFAVEDVFSTYLYTGNGSSQTITNGIDLSGQGGLVWIKRRVNTGGIGNTYHILTDTVRGANKQVYSNATSAQATNANMITSFNANGYSIGSDGNVNFSNASPQTYVSWTFREAPKFFDVVTYTGDGAATKTISHNLNGTVGCVIIKNLVDGAQNWQVYHRASSGTPDRSILNLNDTAAVTTVGVDLWASTNTTFTIYSNTGQNVNGQTYVAYLFAHDAASDGIIQCGSFTTDGSGICNVTLGWEPQWVLTKRTNGTSQWALADTMRGDNQSGTALIYANVDNAEFFSSSQLPLPTATGFTSNSGSFFASSSYVYVAIRRGPMKTPTVGTSVLSLSSYVGNGTAGTTRGNLNPVDMAINKPRNASINYSNFSDRLRGATLALRATSTAAETTISDGLTGFDQQTSVILGADASNNGFNNVAGDAIMGYFFKRAPSFFDEVCYTGVGGGLTVSHNLGVAPELMIVKRRNSTANWVVYSASLGNTNFLVLNLNNAVNGAVYWDNTDPTATNFRVGGASVVNGAGGTYTAYLFASCPGVSKVGSYTGTGALQTINCGFTTGARFVLIKRTDSTGDWYLWDSARGINSGNDPYMLLNSTAAEVSGTNYVDTDTTGFKVTAAAPADLNANGGSYIFLAIS